MDVSPGTVVVYSDIACPWAALAVERLWRIRSELGLEDAVRFDHRAFPLEIFNERSTPRLVLDAEVAVVGGLEPGAGLSLWRGRPDEYVVSSLPALEAVQAAKAQGLPACERLDRDLRRAFFVDSRCITMRHVVLDVARAAGGIVVEALRDALDRGTARSAVIEQQREAEEGAVDGSPHLFLPDGTDAHNPGIQMHWVGPKPGGAPVIDADDPSVYATLLQRAAG